ncbi:MAG: hypothetical protein JSW02_06245 [candidate division WOR-3 bacterium]|nr:MAG: hypothetical protein JSW02_06245 [candidate division WOR-3 bacterium]
MKWSIHPARKHRLKTIITGFFIVCFLVFVTVLYGTIFGLLGLLILFFSLYSYYFPTHYEATENAIIIKNVFMTQRRELSEFKRVYRGKNGILLSPFRRKTFLNHFRGVFLLLPEKRDEITAFLEERIAALQPQESKSSDNG